jgi:uncharacterized protein
MARMIVTVGVIVGIAFVGVTALLWWQQERVVFQPQAYAGTGAAPAGRVDYTAADGQPLFGYLVGDPARAAGLILAFHGNADLAVRQLGWAREVERRTGWAVLLAEYRGYGGLDGRPTYASSSLDAHAALDHVIGSLHVEPADIALYGHSLGSAVATALAADLSERTGRAAPRALLLESPFLSARAMAGRVGAHGALLFWSRLSRFHWDTEAIVGELDARVAVAHGTRDMIIPVDMGKRVHAAAARPGPLLIVDGAGHNDVAAHAGQAYWEWTREALAVPE